MIHQLVLSALPVYESRLLKALAFFRFSRSVETQARHCLAMYLRQSEPRIMAEVGFYAERLGMTAAQLLDLIDQDSDEAQRLLATLVPDDLGEDPRFL
jgi:hypothetical protein